MDTLKILVVDDELLPQRAETLPHWTKRENLPRFSAAQ